MASIAKLSNGTLLKSGDGGGTEVFTTIPEVRKLSGPGVKFDLIDVTSHDTATLFKEYIPGLSDGESIRAAFSWRPSNVLHKALRVDAYAATLRNFKIVFPDSTFNTVSIACYISEITPTADVGAEMHASMTLKVTGAPVWT